MDKNAIFKYAVWARSELIARVTQKAEQYEITEKKTTPADADSIGGRLLTDAEKKQRVALIEKIKADGFEQVMEEVAYTWFNRFIALRFMEVNNYLPSHTRVFTNEAGEFKPQILADAIQLELDGLDMDKVFELKDSNKTEELYKYLLIVQCNALSDILPRMFQKIEHYTELLLPDYLLREGSVIEQMIALIPEKDWTDQVQIIGWLYQYYNSEPKDAVFAALKKNVKITKERIPAATQMFTPDWIVRYMVENSLGRLWLEGHPNGDLKSEWKYYLDEVEQETDVQEQLDKIRKEYAELKPEEIRCIDPCMGSGHILCYMFDVLVKIYETYGYTAREAVGNIVEKNLWGLDIDERAAQLSYFAVMMKARQYDRRFFTRNIQPHVYAIEDSNGITSAPLHDMGIELSQEEYGDAAKQAMRLLEEMHDAKEYGSIIYVTPCDWDLLRRFAIPRGISEGQMMLDIHGEVAAAERLQALINVGEVLSQKYHAVITNPPYMGGSGMSPKLADFVKKHYPDSKSDMSTVFMEKALAMALPLGVMSMINIPVWMFIGSYEKLRHKLLSQNRIVNMSHCGRGVFGSDFGTTAFVISKKHLAGYSAKYLRLFDEPGAVDSITTKEKWFFEKKGECSSTQDRYDIIPGSPIAYWVSKQFIAAFENGQLLKDVAVSRVGLQTSNNNYFLRVWFECSKTNSYLNCTSLKESIESDLKWYPHNKGGAFRKWYGNQEYVINYQHGGEELSRTEGAATIPENYVFQSAITYSRVTAGATSFRMQPAYCIFDSACVDTFASDKLRYYLLGLLNTKLTKVYLSVIAPTINTQPGDIAKLPILLNDEHVDDIERLVKECIQLEKDDWDSFETSWEFLHHPIIRGNGFIKDAFEEWQKDCGARLQKLKENETRLNQIFIDIYGLQDEMSPEVEDEDITIRQANLRRDIRSLISYAVGCMLGRYSLSLDGIAYAGGTWGKIDYSGFTPDEDGIIPILDDEYFADDIVGRFVEFIETAFGKEYLEENLRFIADALGGKGLSRDVIRNYFINDFYADHCSTYSVTGSGKRPIYWLFDSGKKNGFKCLIYMHRYQPDTIARIRTDYVHEQQSRYRTAIADLEQRMNNIPTSERVKLSKNLVTLQEQAEEVRLYEEKIHHLADQMISIDLDDGVKHNYEVFKDVLAKIK